MVTSMDCAKQGHSATSPIKIHHREIELAASLTHNLQRIGDTSCRENDDSGPPKRFSQHSIEVLIARVEKNYPRFHPDPMAWLEQYDPPHLDMPTRMVDCSSAYAPSIEEIIAFTKTG